MDSKEFEDSNESKTSHHLERVTDLRLKIGDEKTTTEKCDVRDRPNMDFFGARHTLALMGFLGLTLVYTMRVNLSVAIVAMVNNKEEKNVSTFNSCPLPANYSRHQGNTNGGEFDWDENTQGLVLGSFYYGYILTNIIGGLAAERFGGRIVNGLGVVLTALLTIISPFAAKISSGLFITVRILEGCAEGVTLPALSILIAKWYPMNERSKFTATIYAGMQFGTVVTLPISGWLASSDILGGWPSVFYVFGVCGVIWGVFWFWLIRDEPTNHPRISDKELKYIMSRCPNTKKRFPVPWKAILTSTPFWAIVVMHVGNNWGFYTLLSELPTYLDQILHINMKHNGLLSSMPYFGSWLFSIIFSLITDRLIARDALSILSVRRIAMILAGYGPMLCLIGLCFVNCNATAAMAFLILSGILNGAMYCGFLCSHVDISPRFSGTLMGLTNTAATIPGFVAPSLTGSLTLDNQTLWAWRTVFLISALVYGVAVTIYVIFITTDHQPWNEIIQEEEKATEGKESSDATNEKNAEPSIDIQL